jgi:phage repressor protein C with HTH and peptisase S24 domain
LNLTKKRKIQVTETFAYDVLRRGAEQVIIKPRGHSMEPLIMDRQQVTIRRLHDDDVLTVGDIVLARVRGHVYLHKITAISGGRIQISNNHGHVNGWTHRDRIAGRIEGNVMTEETRPA